MRFILTGATGYLGRHVLARLLAAGHAVSVLTRPQRGRLHARIVHALSDLELATRRGPLPAIEVIAADLRKPLCGIDRSTLDALRSAGHDGFIHCAGLTRFDDHLADELMAHNLDGTRHAHALCVAAGVERFHHVSTAFVAGTSRAVFGSADLALGQGFNNPYERSKHAAEMLLHDLHANGGPSLDIYRPSIIVGGEVPAGHAAATTVYSFIKALLFLRECRRRERGGTKVGAVSAAATDSTSVPLRVAADPATILHLVAIDDVVDALLTGAVTPRAGLHTWSLPGVPISLDALRQAICAGLDISGPRFVTPEAFREQPATPLETRFRRLTRPYTPYLFAAPAFAPVPDQVPRAVDMVALSHTYAARGDGRREPGALGSLALAVAGIHEPRDYLRGLVHGDVGRPFLARHAYVDARVRFDIRGDHGIDETLHIRHGTASLAGETPDSDCCFTLDDELFMRIVAGRADIRSAFFAGQVAIAGNLELALKFGALLGMYYQRIESNLVDELHA